MYVGLCARQTHLARTSGQPLPFPPSATSFPPLDLSPGRVLFHAMVHVGWPARLPCKQQQRRRVWRATSSCRDKTELQRGRPVGGLLEGELLALCVPVQLDCRCPETGLARPNGPVKLACCYFQSDRAARQNRKGCSVRVWVLVRWKGKRGALVVRSHRCERYRPSGLSDDGGCGPRAAWVEQRVWQLRRRPRT